MSSAVVDIAIVGAGPYGLSIAAHLRKKPLTFRVFGTPMRSWTQHMPKGMLLKSDGFASNLFDPDSAFTLEHYCREMNLPYDHVDIPVPLDTFAAYGMEFQRRMVPMLEETDITSIRRTSAGFALKTADGGQLEARNVVVAAGITHYSWLPPLLTALPAGFVTHSVEHHDLSGFKGQTVAIIGAGASALDTAAALHEAGAQVELLARGEKINFHTKSKEPRPLLERIRNPRSGLGLGWRSRIYTDAPLLFHALPQEKRFGIVRRHLGPAPGWPVRDRVAGKFPFHLGCEIKSATVQNGKVVLRIAEQDGKEVDVLADHVIGATGYRVSVARLGFLDESLRSEIHTAEDTPVLSRSFESSVPGLYMVGAASANSFGPLTRFAYGAKFTARHITRHLASRVKSQPALNSRSEALPSRFTEPSKDRMNA
jgi:thioredoxin reductase